MNHLIMEVEIRSNWFKRLKLNKKLNQLRIRIRLIYRQKVRQNIQQFNEMIQRLGNNLQVRLPYKTIFKSQRYMLRRLYDSISTGHNYIGQCKLSTRMTFILLAFLFGLVEQPDKNKVYYICESKARCKEVREMAQKLRQFYRKYEFPQAVMQRTSLQSLQKGFKLQRSQMVILQSFFHKEVNLLKDYPNDKYISILSAKQYFTEIIQQKVHHKGSHSHSIKANYMLLQTVAYDEIIETCISGWINEVVIRRAYIQHKKLLIYYHQRDDKRKLAEKNELSIELPETLKQAEYNLKKRTSNSSIDNHSNRSYSKDSKSGLHGHSSSRHSQEKMWNISQIKKRIDESYQQRKERLLKQGNKKNPNQIEEEKMETHRKPTFQQDALMGLQMTGYLINFLQNYQVLTRQSHKSGKDEISTEECSSEKMIEEMEKKTMIKHDKLRRIYDIIKKLTEVYPPIIHPEQYLQTNILYRKGRDKEPYILSVRHILHLAKFCKELIDYNETFNPKYNQCIEVTKSCYKERDRPSFFQIKFKCLNQPLLTEVILQFNNNFIVLMNNGISLDFYSTIFKPKILMKTQGEAQSIIEEETLQNDKSFKFSFDSPTTTADHIFNNIYGLNVTITPSEENLKIPDTQSRGDAEHDSLIIKAFGVLLFDLCEVVSDGIIVYFPNSSVISKFKREWMEKEDIYTKINQVKRIFEESEFEQQNVKNVADYKKVCEIGRGGIYFMTANGGMAKYTQFYGHYSRCVVFVGIPKISQSRKKQSLTERQREEKKKRQLHLNLKQAELETFYGLKTTAKCLSNCINCNLQPKSVIFADVAYNKQSTKKWFPFIQEGNLNTSQVIDKVKKFHQHSQKRYEEGVCWEMGRVVRKPSSGKHEFVNRIK